ncbi:MAG: hypothetical protein M1820_001299 [Bogoriella megaspora]|nr:MAG: hypothetical protein M1820_001299 [Bogoriella megaspora]
MGIFELRAACFTLLAVLVFVDGQLSPIPPLSIPSSGLFDGIDGPWSTFPIQVGTPAQEVRVIPGTNNDALWVVLPQGCDDNDPKDCPKNRTVFDPTHSSSWALRGIFHLGLAAEKFLGSQYNPDDDNAEAGDETYTLGSPGSNLPAINDSVVEGIATKDFYMGHLGLSPQDIHLDNTSGTSPSPLQSLKDANHIASLSWSYTAGSANLDPPAFGSLTLGGYDSSRFTPNDLVFPFGSDPARQLTIGVQGATSDVNNDLLLTEPIDMLIDSLVPEIWLPQSACENFESSFGLEWNSTLGLYIVNDTLHDNLTALNPNITFQIGPTLKPSDGQTKITLPYSAFDLTINTPVNATTKSRYFPLKRANNGNSSQYVLGRTFLQHAYVTANYVNSTLSVSQALFPPSSTSPQLVAIGPSGSPEPLTTSTGSGPDSGSGPSASAAASDHKGGIGGGAIAGIVIGVLAALAIVGFVLFFLRRKKKNETLHEKAVELEGSHPPNDGYFAPMKPARNGSIAGPEAELDSNPRHELASDTSSPRMSPRHIHSWSRDVGREFAMELVGDDGPARVRSPAVEMHAADVIRSEMSTPPLMGEQLNATPSPLPSPPLDADAATMSSPRLGSDIMDALPSPNRVPSPLPSPPLMSATTDSPLLETPVISPSDHHETRS